MSIDNIKAEMQHILYSVVSGSDTGNLREYVQKYIESNSHNDGCKLYHALCKIHLECTDENQIEVMNQVLDCLSGWCHKSFQIGTGDYHLNE